MNTAATTRRLLIVRTGAMGDILHGLPAVAALKAAAPDWHIGWALEPHWLPLLRSGDSRPLVDSVHLVPTREWKRHPLTLTTARQILSLRKDLRAARYDVCVDLQGSLRSGLIGHMASALSYVGSSQPRESAARLFYSRHLSLQETHVTLQACELLGAATGLTLTPAPPTLPSDPEAEAWCSAALTQFAVRNGFVLLAPTAGWGAKEWGAERFAELARRLAAAGHQVLVNAAPGSTVTSPLQVPCTLPQLIALTRRAGLVIAGDTGPLHLGGALGIPVVALFGPTDPARTGPLPAAQNAIILRDVSSITDHRRHAETETGLKKITVEQVLRAALELTRKDP